MKRFLGCLLAACLTLGVPLSGYGDVDENGIEPNSWITFDEQSVGTISASTTFANHGSNTATWTVTDGAIVSSSGTGKGWTMGGSSYQTNLTKNNSVHTTTYIVRVNFNGQTFSGEKVVFAANGKAYGGLALTVAGGGSSDYTIRVRKHVNGSSTEGISCTVAKAAGYHWLAVTTSGSTMNSTTLYVDGEPIGSLSPSENWYSGQNSYYVFGKWGGNGGDAVPTGITYDEVRSYEQVLTAAQIKTISGRSTFTWGTAGRSGEGVSTKNDGSFENGSWTFNLSKSDGIVYDEIDATKPVTITSIRMMQRANKNNKPTTATLKQGTIALAATSVTSHDDDATGMVLYDSTGVASVTRGYHEFVFDGATEFDPSVDIQLVFDNAKTGCSVTQPANSVMAKSGWSPVIEITGVGATITDPRNFTATLDGTKRWSELEWTPALPKNVYARDTMTINVTGTNPTLLMDTAFSGAAPLTISGGAVTIGADEALYEDGCWQKDILKAKSITITTGSITFPAVISGFVGAYSQSANAITLRAQNKEVISINFADGTDATKVVSGTAYTGLAPVQGDTWMNMTEAWSGAERTVDLGTFKATPDGSTVTPRGTIGGTCTAANTYRWTTATDAFLKGYLDDGGNHAWVSVTNIPYSSYDVIVYRATDSGGYKFAPVTLNGTQYTYDSANPTTAKVGTDTWGASQNKTAVYGTNAIRIRNIQSSSLTIDGGANANTARGGIAAIQIVCTGDIEEIWDFTATISESAAFDDIQWNEGPFTAGVLTKATITVDDSSTEEVEISFDTPSVTLQSLTIISKRDVQLVASAALVNVASIDISRCTGKVTYAMPVTKLVSGTQNVVYTGGSAEGLRIGIDHQGGSLNIEGGSYAMTETHSDEQTAVNVTGAELNYGDALALGKSAYVFGGNSKVNAVSLVLVQGLGNDCSLTLRDTAVMMVSGTTVDDSNKNSVMFGHWDGDSVFTLADSASFLAEGTQVLVGKTGGDHTINIGGGVFTTKGIIASASATGTNTLNIEGGTLRLGTVGISSYASTAIAVHVTGNATIVSTARMPITQPVTIDEGATLTIDATAGDVILSGKLVNAGKIKVTGGNLVLVDADAPGAYETEGTGKVLFGFLVTFNNCGKLKIPDGMKWNEMHLFNEKGEDVAITGHDDKYVYFEWKITGDACWWDYEFEGNGNNTGSEGTPLNWDGGRPFSGNEYVTDPETGEQSLHIPSRPWRNVGSWPNTATFVMYGTMVGDDNRYYIVFGSTTGGTKNTVFLATDDISNDKVVLCSANGLGDNAKVTKLCTMTVPNAQTSKHLYAFVLKKVGENSVIDIYLDGELLQPYTFSGEFALGPGFQIASPHGGEVTGYARPVNDDPALVDWLRVYDFELGETAMAEYAKLYPYVTPNGSYQRDVSDEGELWKSANAWHKEGTTTTANAPVANSTVKISALNASGLAANLDEDVIYESMQISGDAPFSLTRQSGFDGKVKCSGRVTVSTDVTFAYDAFSMVGAPLTVKDGCTVTFDMSSLNLGDVWSSVTYELTGLVTTGANARVECVCSTVPEGRTISYGIDPVDQHFRFTVSLSGGLRAELAEDATFDELEWKIGEQVVYPDWTKQVYGTIDVMGEATLTFASDIASNASILTFEGDRSVTLVTGSGRTVTGVNYDFTGLHAKATFEYNPTPATIKGGYVRYDLDMGQKNYGDVIGRAGGTNEFRKVVLNGAGSPNYTIRIPAGDEVTIRNSLDDLHASTSFDVCGGTLYLGAADNAAIWYGATGTRFNMSSGTTVVRANGQEQEGTGNGFLVGYEGVPSEFNVSGGLLDVSGSSINFYAPVTNNVSGGIVRAKGIFADKSAGVINVSGSGALEVGSLGVKANACALNLNGGMLRGYEAGATCANSITLLDESKLGSTEGADLAVSGGVTGTGAITIAEGTVKLGKEGGLGTGTLTVQDGATLDLNGFKPANAITISGVGANGNGALANTGAAVNFVGKLVVANDATLGGSGQIGYMQGSTIDLGGHKLTIAGNGVTLALWSLTVQNGGTIAVGYGGVLATKNQAALGETGDLVIEANGTLNLTEGTSVSCRNFTSAGTVTGDKARLIVRGTLDASNETRVTNLTLSDKATLKGQGLVVTTELTLGDNLYVTVDRLASSLKIAEIPEGATIPVDKTTVIVNGKTDVYTLRQQGTSLLVTSGGDDYAEVVLSSATAWTNFEALKIDGVIKNARFILDGVTNVEIVVTSASGVATTRRFVYEYNPDWRFSYVVDGLTASERYSVSAQVLLDDRSVGEASAKISAMTARTQERWIDEDRQTFGKKRVGTGDWVYDPGAAWGTGNGIAFKTSQCVEFVSTNATPNDWKGALKEIRISATFTDAAYCVGEDGSTLPAGGGVVAVALATNALGQCQFAVATNGQWCVVDRARFEPAFGADYEIVVQIDEMAKRISYGVVQDATLTWLYEGDEGSYTPKSGYVQIVFSGAGSISKIDGALLDVNLFRRYGAYDEYPDLDSAIEAIGADGVVEPIWHASYRLHEDSGSFSYCTNGLLTIRKDKWYHVVVEPGDPNKPGSIRYSYCAGNNWIEYADEKGVESDGNGGYRVTSEEGLAWIAEQATNAWFSGDVALDANLDLSSKNWTPIALFTGAFDGRGFAISGLNNTNVIDDVALGEAGRYSGGTTNDWGYSAYGLFGCATNATFRNVTLTDVAISNAAESVAALLGVHTGGDLEVVGVVVTNGFVCGEGRAVAGLLTVGGRDGAAIGDVVVTNNANYTAIVGSVSDDEAGGGNVAQILAGTTWGTTFGEVAATNNVGEGAFDVSMSRDFDWLDLPVCNFAPAVVMTDENYDFWSFVEANDPLSIPIDPVLRTARMSAGRFPTGDPNVAGWWTDTISAVPNGAMVTLQGTDNTLDVWNTILVDRDIAFDLNANCVYGLYDCNVFEVADGKTLTLKNGVLYYAHGYLPTNGTVVVAGDVRMAEIPGETLYDRTVPVSGLDIARESATIVVPYTSEYFYYVIENAPSLVEEWKMVNYAPGNGGTLSFEVPTTGDSGFYRVRITDLDPSEPE